ncbi:hypothetical protein QN277_001604 [Acacia crassicarpa]|uniref:Uncharacterized protein n=1 Tax=Acacia crassicarpa TaxID=499986 RepID=A0AAE1TGZ6_9FABA|nr:hypothetical protein QN277_001604 [Acacia crassicarpa]
MSGNLRSRRRPPYGTYICAAISSILLMLSVSFLYSTLSHSHPHFRTNLYHRNSRPLHHPVNYDSLLSDSADDNISGNEDKIDVLDVIEEQQEDEDLRNFELEEEDEPFEQIKVSGHLFDHVSGVIRRAYDKRSIEAWEDTQTGFFMGSGVEDRSKAAFGSDDVPVDDLVRTKSIQVTGIEDALLLKVGKRVSPLREGWGDWFDKKADFLRKDKMLKSNVEGLNPLHNPILQDPDGVGVTGLTKGDRSFQKSLIEDFKKVPFPYLGSTETRKTTKLRGNVAKARECDGYETGGKMFPVDDSDVGKCIRKTDEKAQEHP